MGAVNFTSLRPALINGSLREGSKCQLYGCIFIDNSIYYNVEGETCYVPGIQHLPILGIDDRVLW